MKLSKELKVALLAIVSIVALYVGFLFLKGTNVFSSTRTYYVEYENVEGLNKSNPVVLKGLHVGLVKDMTLQQNRGNKILVTLDINKDIIVGDSTVAMLVSSDLLGGKAIELYMGRNKQEYNGGEKLIAFTKQSLTDVFTAKATPVIDTVATTLSRLNAFLGLETQNSIKAILQNAEATSGALRAMTQANQSNITQITQNLAELTRALRATESKFDRVAGNLATLSDTIDAKELNETFRNLNATVTQAQLTMQKLNETNGTLGRFMNDDSLYRNLNASSNSLNALLTDLKANPKRYVHFSLIGGGTKVDKADNVKAATKVKNANVVESTQSVEEIEKK